MIALVLCLVGKIIEVAKSAFSNCELEQFEPRNGNTRKRRKSSRKKRKRKGKVFCSTRIPRETYLISVIDLSIPDGK